MNHNHRSHDLKQIARQAMLERGLLPDFSREALQEAAALHAPASADPAEVRDLRAWLWCSIDNDNSRDLDQLTVAENLADGVVRIFVAIADVDACVPLGHALDDHARQNTTSVYTPAIIFSMLPEKLSTDLTSLNPDQDRLAVVVELDVKPDGSILHSDVYRANVRNHAKLAYNSVAAWLKNDAPMPPALAAVPGLEAQIRLQDKVAQSLKRLRHERGALDLETIEARAVYDGDKLTDLKLEEKNRAKELIEDFMIAANGVTANFLQSRKFPSLRRIVRAPERWQRIVDLAATLNVSLPAEPNAAALEAFLVQRKEADPLRFPDLSLTVVKLMGKGEYVVNLPGEEPVGHFGLAVRDYAHSTAPNRRYPDLITQRLVKSALAEKPAPYSAEELAQLASHCTDQEDNATKVERQVRKSAAALLLEHRIGERFDALVTGASSKGTYIRTFRPPVEGKVIRNTVGMDVGDRVKVQLSSVNVERGFIDFVGVS